MSLSCAGCIFAKSESDENENQNYCSLNMELSGAVDETLNFERGATGCATFYIGETALGFTRVFPRHDVSVVLRVPSLKVGETGEGYQAKMVLRQESPKGTSKPSSRWQTPDGGCTLRITRNESHPSAEDEFLLGGEGSCEASAIPSDENTRGELRIGTFRFEGFYNDNG